MIMKRIFLLALGTGVLILNAQAQETVWQQMGRAMDTSAQVDVAREARQQQQGATANAIAQGELAVDVAREARIEREETRQVAQAKAEAEMAAKEARDAKLKARDEALKPWFEALATQGVSPADREMRGLYQDWLK